MAATGPLRVLWVEDDRPTVDGLYRYLIGHGCRIDFAPTAVLGFEAALSGGYDALLVDWKLPDGFGTALLSDLRSAGVATPVVILTGFADYDLAVEVGRLGGQALRPKFGSGRALLATLQYAASGGRRGKLPRDGAVWAAGVVTLLDDALEEVRALGDAFGRDEWDRFLGGFIGELADAGATVPGTLNGLQVVRRSVISRDTPWPAADTLTGARRLFAVAPMDTATLHAAVAGGVALFEAGGRAATHAAEHSLAAAHHIDAAHFGRILKKETRLPFRRWRSGARLREAVAAMVHSGEQLGRIAEACGWTSLKQFERQFKAAAGVGPVEFRRLAWRPGGRPRKF